MDFQVEEIPISNRCKEILVNREHALIGISPFNSYYSEKNISRLIYWAKNTFKDFHLILPDKLPYFNLVALGYTHEKSLRKTNKQARYLLNQINRACQMCDISEEDRRKKVLHISEFSENPVYCALYEKVCKRYDHDVVFKEKCHNSSAIVLKSYALDVTSSALNIASKYLLGELPFYMDVPKMLCVNSSLTVYHQHVDFFANLFINRESNSISDNQGHLILRFKNE